jgi:NADP-dependent 3-hydroxy acid dehydrogenase YdfG
MQEQGTGHIVNVSSVGGHRALSGVGVYSATKFAINGFSEALRQDLAGTGIRVTVIEPGTVLSEMTEQVLRERGTPPGATLPPRSLADAILFAITQPDSVNVALITVLPAADKRPW